MRTIVIGVWSFSCFAQSTAPRVSLELGTITVWLGMTRQEVINSGANAGFKQLVTEKDGIFFQNGNDLYKTEFKDDRLVYASREWYSSKGELDAFQSTVAALGSISDNVSPTCTISHDPINKPDMQLNRLFIFCGKRSFLLSEGKMGGKTVSGVSERIGEMLPTK